MKTTFNKEFALTKKGRGCYDVDQIEALPFNEKGEIELKTLFTVLPIKDFCWTITNHCELSQEELKKFTIKVLEFVKTQYLKEYNCKQEILSFIDASIDLIGDSAAYAAYRAADRAAYRAAAYAAAAAAAYSAAYAAAAYAAAAYWAADRAAYWAEPFALFIKGYFDIQTQPNL